MQPLSAAAGIGAAWALFEAQWVELREVETRVHRLPQELDGVTILHLSDFHLGTASLNGRTLERAVASCSRGDAARCV